MNADRNFAGAEFSSGLFAKPTRNNKWKNLPLTRRQPRIFHSHFDPLRVFGFLVRGGLCRIRVGRVHQAQRFLRKRRLMAVCTEAVCGATMTE